MMTKRMLLMLVAAALSVAAVAPVAAGELPPAEKVVAKYAEAIGAEALAKVENMSAKLDFSMPMQGVYAEAEELWVRPGQFYFRIDLAAMGVTDFEAGVVDGVAWKSHPMSGTRELTGAEKAASLRRASRSPFSVAEDSWSRIRV